MQSSKQAWLCRTSPETNRKESDYTDKENRACWWKTVEGKAGRLTRPTIYWQASEILWECYQILCWQKKLKQAKKSTKQWNKCRVPWKQCCTRVSRLLMVKRDISSALKEKAHGVSSKETEQLTLILLFENKPHHLDPVFLKFLTPLFNQLNDKKLLKRCLPGLSQNANDKSIL